MQYQNAFTITANVSNNAFSFEKRKNPALFVPAMREGTIDDVRLGSKIVFEDFDDSGKLQSCCGLEDFVKTSLAQTPTCIFDNHNHAFYFWCEKFLQSTFSRNALLIHVDQHKDNRMPQSFLQPEDLQDLQKVFTYTNTILNVGNFIPPAQKLGLIGEIIFLDSRYALDRLARLLDDEKLPSDNMILDIDLDFFAPEFDYIGNDLKLEILARLMPKAKLITIATSPFFIDQNRALEFLAMLDKK